MSRRAFRIVALASFAALLLGAAGVVALGWVADYRSYLQFVSSAAQLGGPETSLEEFLLYRRTVAFYDAADRLTQKNATAEEAREALGEPDHISTYREHELVVWFYTGPVFRDRRQPTIVVDIDLKTSRVTSVQYIRHN